MTLDHFGFDLDPFDELGPLLVNPLEGAVLQGHLALNLVLFALLQG